MFDPTVGSCCNGVPITWVFNARLLHQFAGTSLRPEFFNQCFLHGRFRGFRFWPNSPISSFRQTCCVLFESGQGIHQCLCSLSRMHRSFGISMFSYFDFGLYLTSDFEFYSKPAAYLGQFMKGVSILPRWEVLCLIRTSRHTRCFVQAQIIFVQTSYAFHRHFATIENRPSKDGQHSPLHGTRIGEAKNPGPCNGQIFK